MIHKMYVYAKCKTLIKIEYFVDILHYVFKYRHLSQHIDLLSTEPAFWYENNKMVIRGIWWPFSSIHVGFLLQCWEFMVNIDAKTFDLLISPHCFPYMFNLIMYHQLNSIHLSELMHSLEKQIEIVTKG